nr:TlpA disulfide reductase family protein [Sinomicrobium weinanense]
MLILVVLAFFVTPLGDESKILLNKLFASTPEIAKPQKRQKISGYDWKLKDEDWKVFNFKQSEGRVVFVNFWASWRIPSVAELEAVQKLYDDYGDKVDFYIITNEKKEPVEKLMEKRGYTFPVTYLIIGEEMPFDPEKVPSGYIVDKEGNIAASQEGVGDWDSREIRQLLDTLTK